MVMRRGIVCSVLFHAVVLTAGYYGMPSLRRLPPVIDAAIVVELVTVGEETNAPPPEAKPEPEPKPEPKPAKPEPKKKKVGHKKHNPMAVTIGFAVIALFSALALHFKWIPDDYLFMGLLALTLGILIQACIAESPPNGM